jgi:cyclopropane fatty-acyl-phospholipid synthase-like methyltransferase
MVGETGPRHIWRTMSQLAHTTSPGATTAGSTPASVHNERGRSHALPLIFWLLEQNIWLLLSVPTLVAVGAWFVTGNYWIAAGAWVAVPLVTVVIPLLVLVARSHAHDAGETDWTPYIQWKDAADSAKWAGKKIPMEVVYEAYMAQRLEFTQDVYKTLLRRNQLFRFCFTWGDVKFYFKEFLRQNVTHSVKSDEGDIAHVYNRGNDFYNWFLGDGMTYTSGIFQSEAETLEQGQERKLETVCRYLQLKPGERHLDIGCGWGPLVTYAAKHYGTTSTGITLAQEQAEWARRRAEAAGVSDKVELIVDDYRNLPNRKWDKISCLEMAEHVGIKNFQKFLLQVRNMLADDGIFYLQIAGLRRPWQYEDLVWGLFMAKYIFPGADASCPLGFVVSQAERAGFEVHRVENCGVHYGVTIKKWYENWQNNREAIVAKYGERWFRMWTVFLGWSVIIAGQGSSTVFMITLTKNTKNDKSTVASEDAVNAPFSRTERWIGPNPVATQQ